MRIRLAPLGLLLATHTLIAQLPDPPRPLPPTVPLTPPQAPSEPQKLPPSVAPQPPITTAPHDPAVRLPQKENLQKFDAALVRVRETRDGWQLWSGVKLLRDFGMDHNAAEDARKAIRDLRATEWATIGGTRTVVEYGIHDGKAPTSSVNPRSALPVDIVSVRAEQVRGVWVMRDDHNILLNFGTAKQDAEQAAAVARKYGFNHLGLIGEPASPKMTFFFAAKVPTDQPRGNNAPLATALQEQNLTRTGIAVPGLGFVGEQLKVDFRRVEVRKERGEFVLAHGTDVFAKFGPNDWTARDALKVVQECRFTEFCKVGSADVTFFLVNGAAPTKVPFMAQGIRFNPTTLKARQTEARWGVFETSGRMLFSAATADEAGQLIKLVQAYQFDQMCQVGMSPRASLKFLAKVGR